MNSKICLHQVECYQIAFETLPATLNLINYAVLGMEVLSPVIKMCVLNGPCLVRTFPNKNKMGISTTIFFLSYKMTTSYYKKKYIEKNSRTNMNTSGVKISRENT